MSHVARTPLSRSKGQRSTCRPGRGHTVAASHLQVVEFGNELRWKLELKQWHPLRPVAVVSWARFVPHLAVYFASSATDTNTQFRNTKRKKTD